MMQIDGRKKLLNGMIFRTNGILLMLREEKGNKHRFRLWLYNWLH